MKGNAEALKQFKQYIKQLELSARGNPTAYNIKMLAFALWGYLFLLLLFCIAAGIISGIVFLISYVLTHGGFKGSMIRMLLYFSPVILGVLGFACVMGITLLKAAFRLLWYKAPNPVGVKLEPGMAPRLVQMVQHLRTTLKAPPIHAIYIDDSLGAGVMQNPRMGLLGGYKNILVLGLPCLITLTPDQLKAVIAHEFAHITGKHSLLRCWLNSVWETWESLENSLDIEDEEHHGIAAIRGFMRSYLPKYFIFLFVLYRANEYEADRCAKRIAGQEQFAASLVTLGLRGKMLSDVVLPSIEGKLKQQQLQPEKIFSTICDNIEQEIPREIAQQWLKVFLQEETSLDDSHPCLAERLKMAGYSPLHPDGDAVTATQPIPLNTVVTASAAQYYLATISPKVITLFDKIYAKQSVA